jgi:hypothetical protein
VPTSTSNVLMIGFAAGALAAIASSLALGSVQLEQIGSLSNNQGIVIDVPTFRVVKGTASEEVTARLAALNAKQLTQGAIVFRAADKLYVVDANPGGPPHMMRGSWPPQTIDDFNAIFTTRMR